MAKQTGRATDNGKNKTTKTNFATKGIMPGDEGTAVSRKGGGIGGTLAELFSKKK